MKRIATYLLIALMSLTAMGKDRPKIALVLSGGGAKGSAHVGALKVIEEVGIPIDLIVGTSMGSLVGGLYSYGYNAEQLDSILSSQDWMNLLTDKKKRKAVTLADRRFADKYALNINFERTPTEVIEGGILKGNNVSRLLCELTADRLEPMDFNQLPIPFACVATDLATNSEIDMTSGILAESMRCSMSIPGVFSPIRKDSLVLVDGGLLNNYPVDLARELGADIVIGVDVTSPLRSAQKIKTAPEILGQVLDIACKNKFEENVGKTDIYIQVNVQGYSSSSFKAGAIDTLIQRGEEAARQALPDLIELRRSLGMSASDVHARPALQYNVPEEIPSVPTIYNPNEKKNWLGLGFRFDDEEYAAIMLGGRYWFKHRIAPNVYAEIRLGERLWGKFGANFQLGRNWWVDGGYRINYSKSKLYDSGKRMNDIEYVQNKVWLQFSRNWHNITFHLGGEFNQVAYEPLVPEQEAIDTEEGTVVFLSRTRWWKERSMRYFINAVYDNMDARAFPTRGVQWSLLYEYYTDNGALYKNKMGMHQVMAKFRMAIPLTENSTLLPSLAARFIPEKNEDYFNMNLVGGIDYDGRYLEQQLSFAGIKYAQQANTFFGVVGAMYRYSFPKNHFAFGVFNYGLGLGKPLISETAHKSDHYYGAALGYGYKTPVGPVEAHFSYSNKSRFGFTIQLGYKF